MPKKNAKKSHVTTKAIEKNDRTQSREEDQKRTAVKRTDGQRTNEKNRETREPITEGRPSTRVGKQESLTLGT